MFYVGKGTWTSNKKYIRASTTCKRNVHWKRIVAKYGDFTHEIIAEFDNEQDAFNKEIELIKLYGRSIDGGILCNMTLGGEGHFGLKQSEETKLKKSISMSGKVRSQAHCEAISKAKKGYIPRKEVCDAHSKRMTGSGNPNFGTKNSQETISKRIATRGKKCSGDSHPFYGKKRPQHVVDILREKQSKKVLDKVTGQVYGSIKEAASAIGKSHVTVWRWLSGERANNSSLEFA